MTPVRTQDLELTKLDLTFDARVAVSVLAVGRFCPGFTFFLEKHESSGCSNDVIPLLSFSMNLWETPPPSELLLITSTTSIDPVSTTEIDSFSVEYSFRAWSQGA